MSHHAAEAPLNATGRGRENGGQRATTPWALLLVVLVAVVSRSWNAGVPSLWFDEAFSWRMTRFPAGEIIARTIRDNNPPLYYLLLKAWIAVCGDSAWALRCVSIAAGVLTVIGAYAFLQRAIMAWDSDGRSSTSAARRIGVFGALLVAVSAFQVHWSQEVRMYSLGTALAVWSAWALVGALTSPQRAMRYWMCYSLLTIAFLYVHSLALLSVAAQVVFLLIVLARRCGWQPGRWATDAVARQAGMAWLLIIWAYLPWAPVFLKQHAQVQAGFWVSPLNAESAAISVQQMFADPLAGTPGATPSPPDAVTLTICLVVNVLFMVLVCSRSPAAWLVACLGWGPLLLSLVLSMYGTRIFYVRYLIFAHVFLLTGAAVVIGSLPDKLQRRALSALTVANLLWLSGPPGLPSVGPPAIGERLTARHVDARRGDEPVIVCDVMRFLTMLYPSERRIGWRAYADGGHVVHFAGAAVLRPGEVIDAAQVAGTSSACVWTVNLEGPLRLQVPVPATWTVLEEKRFVTAHAAAGSEFVVRRYRTRPADDDEREPATSLVERSLGRAGESRRSPRE